MAERGRLSTEEAAHVKALELEGLGALNRQIALLGGQMLPLADGTPAPAGRNGAERERGPCPHGCGRALDCPHCP